MPRFERVTAIEEVGEAVHEEIAVFEITEHK